MRKGKGKENLDREGAKQGNNEERKERGVTKEGGGSAIEGRRDPSFLQKPRSRTERERVLVLWRRRRRGRRRVGEKFMKGENRKLHGGSVICVKPTERGQAMLEMERETDFFFFFHFWKKKKERERNKRRWRDTGERERGRHSYYRFPKWLCKYFDTATCLRDPFPTRDPYGACLHSSTRSTKLIYAYSFFLLTLLFHLNYKIPSCMITNSIFILSI